MLDDHQNAFMAGLPFSEDFATQRKNLFTVVLIFVSFYIPFTIIQALSYFHLFTPALMNPNVAMFSVLLNVLIIACGLVLLLISIRAKTPKSWYVKNFRKISFAGSAGILLLWVGHSYLAGTQSSLLVIVLLATFLAISFFLRFSDILFLFIGTHLVLLGVIFLEYGGVIPYAPLLTQGSELAKIYLNPRVVLLNGLIYSVTTATTATIVLALRRNIIRSKSRLLEKRKELDDALTQVTKLQELLPICSSCKKIRDDKGYWQQLENYLANRMDLEFTHGYCPECAEAFHESLNEYEKMKKGDSE